MKKYNIEYNYFGRFLNTVVFTGPQHIERGGAFKWVERYTIKIVDFDGDALIYDNGDGNERRATIQLAPWARRLHGNAPAGTYYGRYIVQLPNGARASIAEYI